MISLFIISTLEGWPEIMTISQDGGDTGPIKDNNGYIKVLFIAFILIGSLFCVNLFVAIISMNFHLA